MEELEHKHFKHVIGSEKNAKEEKKMHKTQTFSFKKMYENSTGASKAHIFCSNRRYELGQLASIELVTSFPKRIWTLKSVMIWTERECPKLAVFSGHFFWYPG